MHKCLFTLLAEENRPKPSSTLKKELSVGICRQEWHFSLTFGESSSVVIRAETWSKALIKFKLAPEQLSDIFPSSSSSTSQPSLGPEFSGQLRRKLRQSVEVFSRRKLSGKREISNGKLFRKFCTFCLLFGGGLWQDEVVQATLYVKFGQPTRSKGGQNVRIEKGRTTLHKVLISKDWWWW